MNDFYKLAFSLGAPIVIEPEWSESQKLVDKGHRLVEEGQKLLDEGYKLWYEGEKLLDEGTGLYHDVVDRYFGLKNVKINWKTGEVTKV